VVAAVIAKLLAFALAALPWSSLLPLHGVVAVLAHAITLCAAFHGAGLVVARLGNQRAASPWLVIQWGIAALIGLSGIAIAAGAGTIAGHAVLVFAAAAVHTGALVRRFAHHAGRVGNGLAGPRAWLGPAVLLAALGVLAVLGAAGDTLARPFDDEGHVLAQLRRVLDTGALGDPIGYPRRAQLGGQIALAAVAAGAGDGFARTVEALAMVLTLGLAVSRIRARDPGSAVWASVLVVTAFALALAPTDPLPCWTAAGLIVALYAMQCENERENDNERDHKNASERERKHDSASPPALPLAIVAGALVALRYEFAPIAAVAVIAAWWRRRRDHKRTAILLGGVCAVSGPFVVARMIAWRSVPHLAGAAFAPPHEAALALRLLLATLIAAPVACVLRLALPDSHAVRRTATATAVALAALTAHVTGAGPYAMRLVWPIAIAFAITLVIELARSRGSGPAALIAAVVMCVFVYEGREAPGRLRWSRRLADAATGITYVQHPPGNAADRYDQLLASVPPEATVAIWIAEPERLDYARHRIIDLRTPIGGRLREFRWAAHSSSAAPLLTQLSASFLLIEADDAHVQRTQTDVLYRFACRTEPPICADDLEAIALHHPVVARRDNLQLVDLRR